MAGLAIPKGLWPKAKVWRPAPTLGRRLLVSTTPTGLWHCHPRLVKTPLGLLTIWRPLPRVAPRAQPWAGGQNPVGIQEPKRAGRKGVDSIAVEACKVLDVSMHSKIRFVWVRLVRTEPDWDRCLAIDEVPAEPGKRESPDTTPGLSHTALENSVR